MLLLLLLADKAQSSHHLSLPVSMFPCVKDFLVCGTFERVTEGVRHDREELAGRLIK